jgi:hypothetical protein
MLNLVNLNKKATRYAYNVLVANGISSEIAIINKSHLHQSLKAMSLATAALKLFRRIKGINLDNI